MSDTLNMTDFYHACVGPPDATENIEDFLLAGAPLDDPIAENDETDHLGFTPLHLAVFHGNAVAVRVLLRYGADITLKNVEGHTPLHVAFHSEALDLAELMLVYQPTFVGINLVNCVDRQGVSHFHIACLCENFDVVEAFIRNNVDVNAPVNMDCEDWAGFTPLHFAAISSSTAIVDLLIQHGAVVNAPNARGYTPLHLAQSSPTVLSMTDALIEHGADVNALTHRNETPVMVAANEHNWRYVESLILNYGANIAIRDSLEYTLLHIVCHGHNASIAKMLILHGADVNAVGWDGQTPLHATVQRAESTLDENPTRQNQIIIELVLRGCDVNARDYAGFTPLHHACRKENTAGALSLLKRGADIDMKDSAGKTPTDHFLEAGQGNSQMTHVLLYFTEILRICGARSRERQNDYVNIHLGNNIPERFYERIKQNCMKELNSMKSTTIDPLTSLDQILAKSRNQMARFVNNTKVQKLGKSTDLEKLFPIYGSMLIRQINKGYARRSCLGPAHDAFAAYGLPFPCVDKVLNYLENDDLNNIITAAKLVVTNN